MKYFFKRQNFSALQQSEGVASGEHFLEAELGFKKIIHKTVCFFLLNQVCIELTRPIAWMFLKAELTAAFKSLKVNA